MSLAYLNGQLVPADRAFVQADDRGLLHGRGLFETFRARGGRVLAIERHVERLRSGATLLGIPLSLSPPELERAVADLTRRLDQPDARVRLTVSAGIEGGPPTTLLTAKPATDYPPSLYEQGASAVFATVRRNETSPLCRVKSLNCLDNVLAREEARARGADEALLRNMRGRLAEGAFTNVFVVKDGELLTPAVADGALPGVARSIVFDLAAALGLRAREASLRPVDLMRADEAFLTNAIAGVLPLTRVEGRAIGAGRPGPVTQTLRAAYDGALTRRGPAR